MKKQALLPLAYRVDYPNNVGGVIIVSLHADGEDYGYMVQLRKDFSRSVVMSSISVIVDRAKRLIDKLTPDSTYQDVSWDPDFVFDTNAFTEKKFQEIMRVVLVRYGRDPALAIQPTPPVKLDIEFLYDAAWLAHVSVKTHCRVFVATVAMHQGIVQEHRAKEMVQQLFSELTPETTYLEFLVKSNGVLKDLDEDALGVEQYQKIMNIIMVRHGLTPIFRVSGTKTSFGLFPTPSVEDEKVSSEVEAQQPAVEPPAAVDSDPVLDETPATDGPVYVEVRYASGVRGRYDNGVVTFWSDENPGAEGIIGPMLVDSLERFYSWASIMNKMSSNFKKLFESATHAELTEYAEQMKLGKK